MKQLLTGWSLMRWLRLGIGVYALIQANLEQDRLLGVAGLLILTMSVFNIGCCGVGGCNTNFKPLNSNPGQIENTSFEEIK